MLTYNSKSDRVTTCFNENQSSWAVQKKYLLGQVNLWGKIEVREQKHLEI